jgi:hypothetical protein
MSETGGTGRTVAGPNTIPQVRHRPSSASVLVSRPAQAPTETEAPTALQPSWGTEAQPQTAPPASSYAPPAPPVPSAAQVKLTVRIPRELRDRFRAMFHYTSAIEGDQSMGELLETLMDRECLRREQEYNGGQPFTGGQIPLLRGRRPRA